DPAQTAVPERAALEQGFHLLDRLLLGLTDKPGVDLPTAPVVELARPLRRQHQTEAGRACSLEQLLHWLARRRLASPGGQQQIGAVKDEHRTQRIARRRGELAMQRSDQLR